MLPYFSSHPQHVGEGGNVLCHVPILNQSLSRIKRLLGTVGRTQPKMRALLEKKKENR